jgi:CRISPR-associated protein Cas1
MIKRTIEISTRGVFLSVELGQLIIRQDGMELQRVPIEDIGVLVVASTGVTYTHAVITRLLGAGAVIVACDDQHLPCGLLLPQDNSLQTQRLSAQVKAAKPLAKQLWRQIVRAKIAHQAEMLDDAPAVRKALQAMAARVRSGDPDNLEAQASRRYWQALLGPDFRRDKDGPPPNNLLNYGYMALRAAVARALAGAGLHPGLGLHHHNRSNTFCLADDMMEPLRPLVDRRVRAIRRAGGNEVDKETRRELLGVLTETVALGDAAGPVMVALERMVASLVRCFEGQSKRLEIPRPWNSADTGSCGSS